MFSRSAHLYDAVVEPFVLPAAVVALEFHYLVASPTGVERFEEVHEVGLFTHEQYLGAFERAGLAVGYDPDGLTGCGLYIGVKAR